MLFSELQRTFEGPKPYTEPDYEYLDKSARIEAICIHETMEEWLARYAEHDFLAKHESEGAYADRYISNSPARMFFPVSMQWALL